MLHSDYNTLLVDQSGSICYICDSETYEMRHLTRAGLDACGLTCHEEYEGRKCYKVLQGLDEPCPFCTNSRLREGENYRWEHYNEKLGRWYDITDTLIRIDGRLHRLEIARDITARMDGSSGQMTMEDILFRCLNTLTREKDMSIAVNRFLESIGKYYQANRAYIFEFDLERQVLNNTFEWCAPGVSVEIENLQEVPMEAVAEWVRKFEEKGEFSITSVGGLDHGSPDYHILEAQGIESLLAAPLIQDGVIVGFIGVDDPWKNQGNLTLLRSVAEFVYVELERRRLMAELEYMSFTDALTGLKNRNQYSRILMEYERRTPETLGVIFVDINGLKSINDNHGHSYGDYVIRQTATILRDVVKGDLFRIGGDEFVALCEGITKKDFHENVLALRKAFDEDRDCNASIGCVWRAGDANVSGQLSQADELMYAEKQSYYHDVLKRGRGIERLGFSSEVVREIEEGQFLVHYQPQVDIQTGKIIGAEALVRKKAEDGGLIPPAKFIPLYEAEGVVSYVDIFVLRQACATVRRWIEGGINIHMAVNFSRVTLMEPDIVDQICAVCAENGVPNSAITIEVTESVSRMDHDRLRTLIHNLNEKGFTISLDDFGSQYSNLAILAAMDFDEVKFDKTLVDALEHNAKSRVVMENSVKMCHGLEGTTSLAEGIETRGQLDLLLDYQCDYGQGYYFSKPVPAEEFNRMMKEPLKT